MEVDGDVVGDAAVFHLLGAVPAEQVHQAGGAVVVPGAVQREVTEHRGVVLERGDQPQPVIQVIEPDLRVGGGRRRQGGGEEELDLSSNGLGSTPRATMKSCSACSCTSAWVAS